MKLIIMIHILEKVVILKKRILLKVTILWMLELEKEVIIKVS